MNAHHEISDERGYILEVDLMYPDNLHDLHQEFPLAPEHLTIGKMDASPIMNDFCPYSNNYKVKKLIGTLNNKKNYILHYQILKLYLQLGLKLVKIHKVIHFKQKPFMFSYISHLANLRSLSENIFEKGFLKILANSCYGKMIEDVRKYKDVRICQTRNRFLKLSSDPFFESYKIYNENLVVCFLQKRKVKIKSCHAIGLSILDYSKLHMYDLFYNHIIKSTNLSPETNTLSMVMSDTDSFLLTFKNCSTQSFLNKIRHIMDFSNYPKDHKFFNDEVKGHLGYLKDEMKGKQIKSVVALKSKCYSIDSEENVRKCKGVPKVATKKISHSTYKSALFNQNQFKSTFHKITSKNHIVSTTLIDKKSISFYDDKRYYLCKIHSVPYGHKMIAQSSNSSCFKCDINR